MDVNGGLIMDKVYLVYGYYWTSTNENPENDLIGIFTTKEKAQEVVDIWKKTRCYSEGMEIEEGYLNEPELPIGYYKETEEN